MHGPKGQNKDVVGIFLHGTSDTRNSQAEEFGEGQYAHIVEHHLMAPVGYKTLAALDHVSAEPHGGGTADIIDSLCIGMMAVIDYVKKLKFAKRVLMITDGTSPATIEVAVVVASTTCASRNSICDDPFVVWRVEFYTRGLI